MLNNEKNILSFDMTLPADAGITNEKLEIRNYNSETSRSEIAKSNFASNKEAICLNLGCGADVRAGFINIDLFSDNPQVVKMDVRKLDFPDNSVDFILASDILEHFSHRQIATVLKEWARVLKPNAQMLIRCPSLRLQAKAYTDKKWDADIASYMIFGGQSNPGDFHCIAFDETSIRKHLANAGLQVIHFNEEDTPQDNGFINLNMTVKAMKPIRNEKLEIRNYDNNNQVRKADALNNNENFIENNEISLMTMKNSLKTMRFHCNQSDFIDDNKNFIDDNEISLKTMRFHCNQSDFIENNKNFNENKENYTSNCHSELVSESPEKTKEPLKQVQGDGNLKQGDGINPQINIVWEGSQFVEHSLALINREHCKNIIDTGVANLSIVLYEEMMNSQSFRINHSSLNINDYQKLYNNDIRYKPDVSEEISNLRYVWIRHQWPPKAERPQGAKWIIMQPWEYSKLPDKFVNIFNQADEIWTPSSFSRNAFVNSGIDFDKVQIIPNGINPQLFKPIRNYKLEIRNCGSSQANNNNNNDNNNQAALPQTDISNLSFLISNSKKPFRFLYVGGTTYRKGFDILLQAYLRTFTSEDNVCLVVKDMGTDSFYKGQTAEHLIMKAKENPHCPAIEYIKHSMTEEEIASLYRSCDVFVSPYRGEGFSLPTLEAMASGLPVIITRGGATDDFTVDENAWYINSEPKLIPSDNTDNSNFSDDTYLLEPDINELMQTLEYVYKEPTMNFSQGIIGSYLARKHWTWKKATMKILNRLDFLYGTEMAKEAIKTLHEDEDELMQVGEAELEYMRGNYSAAEELFVLAIESDVLEDRYLLHCFNRLAQISISKNKYVDAYKYTETAKAISPENPDTAWIIGVILCAEENFVEALETITVVVDNWNNLKYESTVGISLEKHLLMLADILRYMGDLEKAAQIYEAALKVNNYSAEACYGLAMCYKESELFEDARKMFKWAIKYQPDFTKAIEELENL